MTMIIKELDQLEGYELTELLKNTKRKLLLGEISYDTAKEEAQVVIDEVNRRGKEISKKWNKRYTPLTFSKAMR